MNLEQLQDLWADDAKIHKDDPSRFSSQIIEVDSLRSKYWNILNEERRRQQKLAVKKQKVLHYLEGYYKDNLYCEELNRKPSKKIPSNKEERDRAISIDPVLIAVLEQTIDSDQMVLLCQDIIRGLKERSFAFKNYVDYIKFLGGA